MLLKQITIKNFCCYEDLSNIPLHRLTVFIGENDAGKSALLNALAILLTNKSPLSQHYRNLPNGKTAKQILLSGVFSLDDYDTLPEEFRTPDKKELILTKIFTSDCDQVTVTIRGLGFADSRWSSFQKLSAEVQKELLQSLAIQPSSNKDSRKEQFDDACNKGLIEKKACDVEIKFADISLHLPRFEAVASTDYKNPDAMVQRTLQAVVDGCLRPENAVTGQRELIPELKEVDNKIRAALNEKAHQIHITLMKINPRLVSVDVSPVIDFSKSVTATNLMLNSGDGSRLINSFGEGTKKKLWMGLLEWERQTQQELENIPVIRVYDEPDVNLDYAAERKLFRNILESTNSPNSRTQAIVCTHAVTLVDRAPGRSINLIMVDENGTRSVQFLDTDDDKEVEDFLSIVGRSVGFTNSALFYERAFIVVEGESEEAALPILYHNIYGHSLIEDGIVIINLHTCSAWKAILNVLLRHKAELTVLLLDEDTKFDCSTVRVTPEELQEVGYPADFIDSNCVFIGKKEFEDSFATEDIVACLNLHWPKEDGSLWTNIDIDNLRDPNCKFSEELMRQLLRRSDKSRRKTARKPEFAEKIARYCRTESQIPQPIRHVFQVLRDISSV